MLRASARATLFAFGAPALGPHGLPLALIGGNVKHVARADARATVFAYAAQELGRPLSSDLFFVPISKFGVLNSG